MSKTVILSSECIGCGKVLTFVKWQKKKFCSRDCANKFNTKARAKAASKTFTCLVCKREVTTTKSKSEIRKYCSQECFYNRPFGRSYTSAQRAAHSYIIRELWKEPDYRKAQEEGCDRSYRSQHRKKYLSTKAGKRHFKKMLAAICKHPNNAELKLNTFLQETFPKEWKLNVPIKVWIGRRAPDFVNVNGHKAVLELFGDYWHGQKITGRTQKEEERNRIKVFAPWGYKTIIVWEHELRDMKKVKEKIERSL